MSEGWFFLIMGMLLSVPISVGAPYINRAIDKGSARSSKARAARDAKFKAQAGELARDRPALYVYLLDVLVQLAYIGALFGVISGALFTVGQVMPGFTLSPLLFAVGQLVVLIGALIVLRISGRAVQMVREVRSASKT